VTSSGVIENGINKAAAARSGGAATSSAYHGDIKSANSGCSSSENKASYGVSGGGIDGGASGLHNLSHLTIVSCENIVAYQRSGSDISGVSGRHHEAADVLADGIFLLAAVA